MKRNDYQSDAFIVWCAEAAVDGQRFPLAGQRWIYLASQMSVNCHWNMISHVCSDKSTIITGVISLSTQSQR